MRFSITVPFLVRGAIVAVLVVVAGGLLFGRAGFRQEPQSAEAALYTEVKKLLASDAQAGDAFGVSSAISGDTAIMGARLEDAGGGNAGAAYVFPRNEGGADNWGEVKKLTASDAQAGDEFGGGVAISGDTAIVGAFFEDAGGSGAGAAYVFERNQGGPDNWGEVLKLTASDAQAGDNFGFGIAIRGDTAIVGARLEDAGGSDAGAAYVFERNQGGPGNWGEVKKLTSSDAQADDHFGETMAIDGDTAIVGAHLEKGGAGDPLAKAGAAYIFGRNQGGPGNWGEMKKLTASDAQAGDEFGHTIAMSGDTAVVSALFEDAGGLDAGAAYIVQRNQGGADNWGEVKKLTASDAQAGDIFGQGVAMSGGTAIVGALLEDAGGAGAGAAYEFERNEGGADNWGEVKKLTASDAQAGDEFGISAALSGDTAIVGARFEDAGGADAGAAYVLNLLQPKSPTPKPKPEPTGNLSGVADVLAHFGDLQFFFFYCKTRTDHDAATNEVKTASTCFSDEAPALVNLPGNKIPDDPNLDFEGPPPPPPYGNGAPQKGLGSYDPGTDTLVTTMCLENLGGTLGPNAIWVVTTPNAKATFPNQSGIVDIFFGQGIDDCNALTPNGDPAWTLSLNIDTYDEPPYDNVTSVDSDGDGCPDAFELDKQRSKKDCGDDPWNPHDSDLDFDGTFTIAVTVVRADTCPGTAGPPPIGCDGAAAGDTVAGSYFNCQAVLDHDQGDNSIMGRAFCYIDNPVNTVNVEDNGGALICAPFPSANPEDCGDGLPGSPPPGPMADNNGEPGKIVGVLDKTNNRLELDICFENDHPLFGPFMYWRVDVDVHTGQGTVDLWLVRTDCVKPTAPADVDDARFELAEQDDDYDVDQDGCTAAEELYNGKDVGDLAPEFKGGSRDPYSKFDHMDINKDGFINIPDDIIGTAALFGPSVKGAQGNVGPRLIGSVPWAHRNGDIAINIPDDILGVAATFGHNCDGTPG